MNSIFQETTEFYPMALSKNKLITSIVLLLISFQSISAQDDLKSKLSELQSAERADYGMVISSIVETSPSLDELVQAIRDGAPVTTSDERKEKLVAGWSEWTAEDINGVSRPYQIYLPEAIANGESAAAVIIHMHGAVSRPDFGKGKGSPAATGYAGFIWPKVADKERYIVACPAGRQDCVWWSDNGVAHVDAVIRDLQRMFDIPEQSIFGAGFSDGASGCYYRAMTNPSPFAGFIALNGHPAVATQSGKQVYPANMAMSTTYAAMTQQDSLYPTKRIMPYILAAIREDADILAVSYPKMNHQPSYFKDQTPAIVSFMQSNRRTSRSRLRWKAAEASIGKVGGLELQEFASADEAAEVPDEVVMTSPGRLRIGIQFQPNSLKIAKVVADSAADSAGIKADDELLEIDGTDIPDNRKFRSILAAKSFGNEFNCTVRRDNSEVELSGKFPEFVSRPAFKRDLPTGFAECNFYESEGTAVDLTTKNVKKLRIWLPEKLAKRSKVIIAHNGTKEELKVNIISVEEILNNFAADPSGIEVPYTYIDVVSGK